MKDIASVVACALELAPLPSRHPTHEKFVDLSGRAARKVGDQEERDDDADDSPPSKAVVRQTSNGPVLMYSQQARTTNAQTTN